MKIRQFLSAFAMVVILTPNGFEPKDFTIPVGTEVEFKTSRGRYFWPASDEHPTHTAYPAFDSRGPIRPDDSWIFRFDTVGTWKFHDHISPYFTGAITVTDASGAAKSESSAFISKLKDILSTLKTFIVRNAAIPYSAVCRNPSLDRSERIGCWEKVVIAIVQSRGLRTALAFVDREKNRNTAFAADCHVYVHRIGEEYYWKYANDKRIEVSDAFDICEFGFFHGFMQEFTSHSVSITQAKIYCDRLLKHVGEDDDAEALFLQCYHGIGHGLAYLYAPQYWGNNEEIMSRGIADCRTLFPDAPRFCISGVYGGMAAMYWGLHGFTLEIDKENPFALCVNQKMPDELDCYDQFVPVLFDEMEHDMEKAGRFIEKIDNAEISKVIMHHLGGMPAYTLVPKTNDFSHIVESCRKFRSDLAPYCLSGFSYVLLGIGAPAQGLDRAYAFCDMPVLTSSERVECFKSVHKQIADRYSEKEIEKFCGDVYDRHGMEICKTYEKK